MKRYYKTKSSEEEEAKKRRRKAEREENASRAAKRRKERLNSYKGRANLPFAGLTGAPVKEPVSEAETALLLQAMISSGHPGIDFVIGDYNTAIGVDLIVEMSDKEIPTTKWVELVASLDKIYAWSHPPEGFHIIVCYQLGQVKEEQEFKDGGRLVATESPGRYALLVQKDTMDVYVLREILQGP